MPEPYRRDEPVPAGTADPLLWRLAAAVAAAHQPDQRGNCTNLQCRGQCGTCAASRLARYALRVARTRPAPAPPPEHPATTSHGPTTPAAPRTRGFLGWFTTRTPGHRRAPYGGARVPATTAVPAAA